MKISFKIKLIIALTLILVVISSGIATYMILFQANKFQSELINSANIYARLTHDKIGDAFLRYYKTAFYKFRSIILEQKELSSDLTNIQVVDLNGNILYDLEKGGSGISLSSKLKSTDPFVKENLKKMEISMHIGDRICIIAPYINEYGVHHYSIIYYFTFNRLKNRLSAVLGHSFLIGLGIILIGVSLAIFIADRITGHLKTLKESAKRIAGGDFNDVIKIKTGDEFEDVAKAFNLMTQRIRENIWQLNNLVKELKKRDTQKTQFLANISHELRTPLTASLGYVDYIEKEKMGPLNEHQRHALNVIKRNLERLNDEIHSFLKISKYTLEGVKIEPEQIDVSEMIESIIRNFEIQIRARELKIKGHFLAKKTYADEEGIRTVLENLIGNGIKFSAPQTEIEITTENVVINNHPYFQFKILNYGNTIPPSKLKKIFEPFYQLDTTTSRRYGGVGLGLSIAQSIIEAHRGKIWTESKKGATVFKFIIPQKGGWDG